MSDIQMRGPKGCANSLSFEGQTYASKKGIFAVPAEAAEQLKRHGFTVDGEEDAADEGASATQSIAEVSASAAAGARAALEAFDAQQSAQS